MSEQRFFRFLQERIGLDVESVGTAMVERALRQRCTLVQAADLDDYWLRLQQSSDEQQALIEAVVDRIGTDFHELSGRAKDMGSAAVLMSILLALATWGILLWPYYR